ncbi:hypothetical protein TNCV_683041 [Trichonephila clavipes]|nr:hypothetical protein TNCV_683041 [Trichonephila clavipes]
MAFFQIFKNQGRHFPKTWQTNHNPYDFWLKDYLKNAVLIDPNSNLVDLKVWITQHIHNVTPKALGSVYRFQLMEERRGQHIEHDLHKSRDMNIALKQSLFAMRMSSHNRFRELNELETDHSQAYGTRRLLKAPKDRYLALNALRLRCTTAPQLPRCYVWKKNFQENSLQTLAETDLPPGVKS